MGAAKTAKLAGRYLREVIGRHVLWPDRSPRDTYVRVDQIRNRYSFLTLRFLSSSRNPVSVIADKPFIVAPTTYLRHMDDYARLAFGCEHVRFVRRLPRDTSELTLIHDDSDSCVMDRPWRRVITLDYDISRPIPEDEPWTIMPYPMHPLTYTRGRDLDLSELRSKRRTVRFFFAGNADREAYSSASSMRAICARFGMMNRVEVIDALQGLSERSLCRIRSEAELVDVFSRGTDDQCVLALSGQCRVHPAHWLETLACCHVFLAPPGVFMPVCHNIIEAMAVGCIPLTNYADWFFPPLTDRVNCLQFRDEIQLIDRIREVFAMSANEIESLRRGVTDYYDRHLAPESFLDRLRAHPADRLRLFVNSERRQILERVRPGSVIVSGGSPDSQADSDDEGARIGAGLRPVAV